MSASHNLAQRVGVFVDVSNLYHSARHLYKGKVNFAKILEYSVGKRQLIRAIAYVVSADVPEEKGFFDALHRAGFEVRQKELQVFAGGAKKGDWDVGITVDAITLSQKLDVVILITGDGDYLPLLTYLRANTGSRVEVVSFGRSTSHQLIDEADSFIDLDTSPSTFLMRTK